MGVCVNMLDIEQCPIGTISSRNEIIVELHIFPYNDDKSDASLALAAVDNTERR